VARALSLRPSKSNRSRRSGDSPNPAAKSLDRRNRSHCSVRIRLITPYGGGARFNNSLTV